MNTTGKTAAELLAHEDGIIADLEAIAAGVPVDGFWSRALAVACLSRLHAAAETAEKAQGEPVACRYKPGAESDEGWKYAAGPPAYVLRAGLQVEYFYAHPGPRVAELEAALTALVRKAQAVADDCHKPRYARLDEALASARAALGEEK